MTTPSFHGGDAFISYPPLTNIHYELRLDLELKPLSPDGLVLFSGGNGGPGADFVSLSLVGGRLEFRYELGSGKSGPPPHSDCLCPGRNAPGLAVAAFPPGSCSGWPRGGHARAPAAWEQSGTLASLLPAPEPSACLPLSGMAVLQSARPLALGQWHTVTAERMNKDGTLQVDDEPPIKRSSPGKSQGLNLRTSLYLGGVDDALQLPAAANISSPFSGCIGEVSLGLGLGLGGERSRAEQAPRAGVRLGGRQAWVAPSRGQKGPALWQAGGGPGQESLDAKGDPRAVLPPSLQVSVNGKKVDLSYSFLQSRSISQCQDGSPCDRRPCRHGGKCLLTGEFEFQCLCREGYQGEGAGRGRPGSESPATPALLRGPPVASSPSRCRGALRGVGGRVPPPLPPRGLVQGGGLRVPPGLPGAAVRTW